jgi:phospholipase/carboxylesterase
MTTMNIFSLKSIIALIIFSSIHFTSMGLTKNDSLNYVVRVPKESKKGAPMLILLHGYGSNENDLFSLSNQIPSNWLVVSVRAPNKISNNSYCWYSVRMENAKIIINTKEEAESREAILTLIHKLSKIYKVDTSKIVLAGFSQGANIAESTSLLNSKTIKGFAVFSGRFLDELKPFLIKSQNYKNMMAFVAHGNQDNMLPINYAQENTKILSQLGIKIEYITDEVGHSISKKELQAFSNWLSQIQ